MCICSVFICALDMTKGGGEGLKVVTSHFH